MKTVLLFLLVCPLTGWAQVFKISPQDTERKNSYVLTRDGLVVRGRVLRQDSTLITVKKRNGETSFIEADQVVSITPARPEPLATGTTGNPARKRTVFVLRDNVRLEGTFIRRDSTMITVRKSNGQLTFFEPELLVRVDTVQQQSGQAAETYTGGRNFPNRFSPWLLTGQTAYNPEKGRLYYRNTLVLVNELHYGLTRHLSVGVNVNPNLIDFQSDNGARDRLFGVATFRFFSKLTFPIGEQFRVGINAIYQPKQKGQYFRMEQQLVLQGLMSFGNAERNATLGYGLRFFPDYTIYNKGSYITAGVMHKLGRNLTFLSDNTFYLNAFAVRGGYGGNIAELSAALRLNRQRHAFDLGLFSAVQPRYSFDSRYGSYNSGTKAYFYPYLAYNLVIGGT